MGYLIILILIILAIYIAYLIIVNVILPIAGILLVCTLILSAGYAFFISLRSFVKSLQTHINPYSTYVDKSSMARSGIKRNYFFGPGFHQITVIINKTLEFQEEYLSSLRAWKAIPRSKWVGIFTNVFYYVAALCTNIFGFVWIVIFSILLSAILIVGVTIFFVFFASLWIIDRLGLMLRSIHSRCPHCKRLSIIPMFVCPENDCGKQHEKLTPGPYGVLKRKCLCKNQMATTYFSGRSKYKAVCPFCSSELAASDAQQFGIQLVGGISAGKTTFLASFWHEYLLKIKSVESVSTIVTPESAFEELENWFENGRSSATTEVNATMYSVLHRIENSTSIQMTIYDIAGEAFEYQTNDIQQQQFQYCEGLIIIIDPTADPIYTAETISNFTREFMSLKGKHATKTSDVPVAVMITKADLYKRKIGLPKIKAVFKKDAHKYVDGEGIPKFENVQNELCREFLREHKFDNAINLIEGEFSNIQYYAVSAMGHSLTGEKYEPWGVLEPVIWLLKQQGSVMRRITPLLEKPQICFSTQEEKGAWVDEF